MSGTDESCRDIALRLIAGEQPADDAELAAHVGSCLRCFRAAADMRELPAIAALLREGEPASPDPGEAFWAHFPQRVGAAWQSRLPASERFAAGWRRVTSWLRLPVPAALTGAALAAVMVVMVMSRAQHRRRGAAADLVAAHAEAANDEEAPAAVGLDEDPWDLLELADLKAPATPSDSDSVAPPSDDIGPTAAEEVELIDNDDLPAVAQALRTRGRI